MGGAGLYCRKGVSALHCAVTNGHMDMLRLLLESGANANIRGQTYQRTPIFMAGESGNEEMVSLLIQYGAKLNLTDQYGGQSKADSAWLLYNHHHRHHRHRHRNFIYGYQKS